VIVDIKQTADAAAKLSRKSFDAHQLDFILKHTLYSDDITFAQNVFNIINNNVVWLCKNCSNALKFRGYKDGYGLFCSTKCANTSNVDKIKQTHINRYGKPWIGSKICREHQAKLNLQKYGTEIYQQTNEFKQKLQDTWINKDKEALMAKTVLKNLEKYGTEHFFETEEFKNKSQLTCLKKYGVGNAMQSAEIQNKAKANSALKYIDDIQEQCNVKLIDKYNGCAKYTKYQWQCLVCNSSFYADLSIGHRPRCFNCNPRQGTNIEERLFEFLNECGISYIIRSRQVISPHEVDIFIPQSNVAIEANGLIWHSLRSGGKDKLYHVNKFQMCLDRGIKLIQLYEDDILDESKFNIIKSRLSVVLNMQGMQRIYARKCEFKKINATDAKTFCNENHLDAYCNAQFNYGLFHNNKLVSVACFSTVKSRIIFRQSNQTAAHELIRFCCIKNTQVIGALSKFVKNHANLHQTNIISYCDLNWGRNTSYIHAGFEYIKQTSPGFYYIKNNKRHHRFTFAKHKQKQLFENFDHNLTEFQNCFNNNIDVLYNVGCDKYMYKWLT
jgi:hypothetical protein